MLLPYSQVRIIVEKSNTSTFKFGKQSKKKAVKRNPSALTDRDRAIAEDQRQRMYQRDIIDRRRQELDEDSQLCQEYYAAVGTRRHGYIDIDSLADMI